MKWTKLEAPYPGVRAKQGVVYMANRDDYVFEIVVSMHGFYRGYAMFPFGGDLRKLFPHTYEGEFMGSHVVQIVSDGHLSTVKRACAAFDAEKFLRSEVERLSDELEGAEVEVRRIGEQLAHLTRLAEVNGVEIEVRV